MRAPCELPKRGFERMPRNRCECAGDGRGRFAIASRRPKSTHITCEERADCNIRDHEDAMEKLPIRVALRLPECNNTWWSLKRLLVVQDLLLVDLVPHNADMLTDVQSFDAWEMRTAPLTIDDQGALVTKDRYGEGSLACSRLPAQQQALVPVLGVRVNVAELHGPPIGNGISANFLCSLACQAGVGACFWSRCPSVPSHGTQSRESFSRTPQIWT